jgi:multidrug efflux pump subunit AcrA (membrane-fusion protein)
VSGVLLLGPGDVLQWRPVEIGVTSAGRVQVIGGLKAGDSVALPAEKVIKAGMKVTPVFP